MPQRVDFTELHNPMIKFLLDDGTELHMKVVMFSVTRLDDKLPDGQNKHEWNMQMVTNQVAPQGAIDINKITSRGTK